MSQLKFSDSELLNYLLHQQSTTREKLEDHILNNVTKTTSSLVDEEIQVVVHPLVEGKYSSAIKEMYPKVDEPPSDKSGNIRVIKVKDGEDDREKRWVINVSLNCASEHHKFSGLDSALGRIGRAKNLKGKKLMFPEADEVDVNEDEYIFKITNFALSNSQIEVYFYKPTTDCVTSPQQTTENELSDDRSDSDQIFEWETATLKDFTEKHGVEGWTDFFITQKETIEEISDFLEQESQELTIYPPLGDIYAAFELTPLDYVKVVILGQDPYHGPGQATGMCFSVYEDVSLPPSLRNIFKEVKSEGYDLDDTYGDLGLWAEQGVLLINSALTVEKGKAGSHSTRWSYFTDYLIRYLSDHTDHVVWMLWGNNAQKAMKRIDTKKHIVLKSPHPSPLSAERGFFNNNHFRLCNQALYKWGYRGVDWSLREREMCCVEDAIDLLSRDWDMSQVEDDDEIDRVERELAIAAKRLAAEIDNSDGQTEKDIVEGVFDKWGFGTE